MNATEIAARLSNLAERATDEITSGAAVRGARVVSATKRSDGSLQMIFGTWATNTFQPDLLSFDVSTVQPSTTYRTPRGAARAAEKWLAA